MTNLDFGWKFFHGDPTGAETFSFDDSGWQDVTLPHDWSASGPFSPEEISGQSLAYAPGGVGWYRRVLPEGLWGADDRVFLRFDGVYRFSDVWVNGRHMGHFPDGYTGFSYEITGALSGGKTLVCVRADNAQQPNSRWYSGSGIYRHVWLDVCPATHFVHDSTFVQTPKVSPEETSVYILTDIKNDTKDVRPVRVEAEILDAQGVAVGQAQDARLLDPGMTQRFALTLWLQNVRLWDIADPHLYTARLKLFCEGEDAQRMTRDVPFGVRTVAFDRDRGFFLNGNHIKLQGVALHHEAGKLGAAVPEAVWVRRLKLLQAMGVNAVRTGHCAMAPEFMALCDRLGLLVMDEVFDEWLLPWEKNYMKTRKGVESALDCRYGSYQYFDTWGRDNLRAILRRDRNHPSVILWSIGNEIFEQSESFGAKIARELTDICHEEDPTRPVLSACERIRSELPGCAATDAYLSALDVVGFNYATRWGTTYRRPYTEDRERHPEWTMTGAENRNIPCRRGEYMLEPLPDAPIRHCYYYTAMLEPEDLWKATRLHDYIAGDFIWTGFDYMGEACWPRIGSQSGMMDTCGFMKDSGLFWQSQWSPEPCLHLVPHWNWEGHEGEAIPVVCYTNCDEVELFVNGQSYGVQAYDFFTEGQTKDYNVYKKPPRRVTTNDLHLLWMVPFAPGELRAVGQKDGVTFERVIHTAGLAVAVRLTPDRTALAADGTDICHVEIELLDARGHVCPRAGDALRFEVSGAAELLCADNGDVYNHDVGLYAGSFRAYNGRCLVYLRAGTSPGEATLTVSGEGIAPGAVTVAVG